MSVSTQLRVALRADASAEVGIGHIKRSLALAQALRQCGADVVLVTRAVDGVVGDCARQAAVSYVTLGPGDDAQASIEALRDFAPDRVVVDHYGLDAAWHRSVASALGCRIAAIDDLGDRPLDVDVLVDHNHADHARKYAGRLREGARLLVGPRFALLAPPYATAPRHVPRDRVESIGVFMGGTDPAATSALVLRACRQEAGFAGRIEVATTLANPRLAELAAAVDRDAATTLTIDAPDLAGFFARHDLQVGAGGGATWERCCLGAPTVLLITAPNQYAVVPALVDLGAVVSPEPLGTLDAVAIGRAVAAVIDEPARRRQLAARSLDLVDGRGAQRVALALNASALRVRPATAEDSALAHVWRNHEATRRMSVDPAAIDEAGHQQWWQACLVAGDRRLLIGLVGDVPIGVTRVDRQANGAAVVSLYLDPALHGLGLGTALLRAGEEAWCAQAGREVTFEATVLDTNAASKRLFAAAGYIQHAPQRWRKALAIVSARTTP